MASVTFDDEPDGGPRRTRIRVPGLRVPSDAPQPPPLPPPPSPPKFDNPAFNQPGWQSGKGPFEDPGGGPPGKKWDPNSAQWMTARELGVDTDAPASWTKFDNTGFYYDWRPQPYAAPLSQRDIDAQRLEYRSPPSPRSTDTSPVSPPVSLPVQPPAPPAPAPSVSLPPASALGVSVPGQFTDPVTQFVEMFAQQRAQERESPPANSGQALLERVLRDISGQFQAGGFTPAEQEIFQTQAIEPIEQLRAARKQQVLHNLSARGIDPRSGIAIQTLRDVDRQMDAMRIETQRTLAGNAAQERTRRMLQAVELLSGLADQENRRKNEGFQYRQVPLQLADRSFANALQAYNAGGNPLTLARPLLELQSLQQGRSDNWQEALGYLAAVLPGLLGGD